MLSLSNNNLFAINKKSYFDANNVITTIKELFLNIKYTPFYKKLTEKAIYIYFTRYMSFKDQIAFCKIKFGLSLFQTPWIFVILQIKVNTHDKKIFSDKIEYDNIRYLIFWKFNTNIIRRCNI